VFTPPRNRMITGFRREVDEICTILRNYGACKGLLYLRFWTTYRSLLQGSRALNLEERRSLHETLFQDKDLSNTDLLQF